MLYIGVDLGTSAVKLLLMDEKGDIKKIVSRDYSLLFPREGWAEQNPKDWEKAVSEGIKELVSGIERSAIRGIGVGGQMHGLVALDEKDNVIRPAILWNDGRTQKETDYLNGDIGKEKLSKWTGNIAFAGFTAPKLLWMKNNEPELFSRISKIMLPKDYINYYLTGEYSTDYSDASGTLLLDVKNKRWSPELIKICGIEEIQLPRLYESYEVIGRLKPEIAENLNLLKNVVVCAGAGDNAAAAIGTGTVGEGTCNISVGTSGTIFIPSSRFRADFGNALHSFAHADGGYHLMGCMLSAAACNKWWMDDVLKTSCYSKEQKDIAEERLGNGHVYYLPYLMGERAPHNDADARSCFIGLSMDSGRSDMTQAVLEGVAFGMRDSYEAAKNLGITIKQSMICGGGAKSALWLKIFANVLNVTLTLPATEQGPGYGAAILAAVANKEYQSVKEAAKEIVKISSVVEPDPSLARRYEEKYKEYIKMYPALKEIFKCI